MTVRALEVREQYAAFEERTYGRQWSLQDLALGLVGDVGDLVKLVPGARGRPCRQERSAGARARARGCPVVAPRYREAPRRRLESAFARTMDELDAALGRTGDAFPESRASPPRGRAVSRSRSRHRGVTHASRLPLYGRVMEEARSVLERFERIESMRRANAGPVELLAELRALLREAEAWAREEGGDAGSSAVGRLRAALERDMIGA